MYLDIIKLVKVIEKISTIKKKVVLSRAPVREAVDLEI